MTSGLFDFNEGYWVINWTTRSRIFLMLSDVTRPRFTGGKVGKKHSQCSNLMQCSAVNRLAAADALPWTRSFIVAFIAGSSNWDTNHRSTSLIDGVTCCSMSRKSELEIKLYLFSSVCT
jgi:hypothetical protein